MTIAQPRKHPQAQAFHDAASHMREARYFRSDVIEEQIEITQEMAAVVTEVAYFLDRNNILDPIAMEAYRQASRNPVPAFVPTSPEVLLTFPLEAVVENLMMLRDL